MIQLYKYILSLFFFKSNIRYPQILITLAMLYVSIDIMCNVLVYKLVEIGPFLQTGGIFFYPLVFLISDMLAELYGFKMARLVIILDLLLNFFVAAGFLLVIKLPSPQYWHQQHSYNIVLGHLLWLNFSVLAGVVVGSILNIFIMTRLKVYFYGHYFLFRSIFSSLLGEAVMLIITISMLFHGSLTEISQWHLVASDYSFRMIYAVLGAFPATLLVNILKKHEGLLSNTFIFNPFEKITTEVNHENSVI